MVNIHITESELAVMKVLWRQEGSLSTNEIVTSLQAETSWDRSTIRTLLKRLVEKGAVSQDKKGVYNYQSIIDESAYVLEQTRGLINRLYQGSAKDLVASLVDHAALSQEDLSALRAYLLEEV